jgi:hypothetical protein
VPAGLAGTRDTASQDAIDICLTLIHEIFGPSLADELSGGEGCEGAESFSGVPG